MKTTQKWSKASGRKTMLLAGMIVMVLSFGLVVVGCPKDADDPGGGGPSGGDPNSFTMYNDTATPIAVRTKPTPAAGNTTNWELASVTVPAYGKASVPVKQLGATDISINEQATPNGSGTVIAGSKFVWTGAGVNVVSETLSKTLTNPATIVVRNSSPDKIVKIEVSGGGGRHENYEDVAAGGTWTTPNLEAGTTYTITVTALPSSGSASTKNGSFKPISNGGVVTYTGPLFTPDGTNVQN